MAATTDRLIARGADVTLAYAEPGLLALYLPRYLACKLLGRLQTVSQNGVNLVAYSTVRHVVRRTALLHDAPNGAAGDSGVFAAGGGATEREVHVGTTFDTFKIVEFRTDRIVFAPTACDVATGSDLVRRPGAAGAGTGA